MESFNYRSVPLNKLGTHREKGEKGRKRRSLRSDKNDHKEKKKGPSAKEAILIEGENEGVSKILYN